MLCMKSVSSCLPESRLLINVNSTVGKGDIATLVGPPGCGKSTLFSWMVGTLAGRSSCIGELWLNEQWTDMPPTAQRQIGILFQDALLFDQFSVGQNLLLALSAILKGSARRNAVNDAPERSGLDGAFRQDPATLSGGQRMRVALLCVLLAQPKALLLDEPFSRLDVALRDNFRHWVFSEIRTMAIPVMQVTHDLQNAPSDSSVPDMAQWSENYNKLRQRKVLPNVSIRNDALETTMLGFSMKCVSQMTALAMALGLACASPWATELVKLPTLDQLQQ